MRGVEDSSARSAPSILRQDPPAGASTSQLLDRAGHRAVAVVHFADGVRLRLDTGMTGFDSHLVPRAVRGRVLPERRHLGACTSSRRSSWPGSTRPTAEIFHAVGMLAFDRDMLSPLLNLGWFVGCLFACWCIGRPYGVAPWSLALGAIALSVPALADQAGEARNDIVGIFFLLAAVAIALNAWRAPQRTGEERGGCRAGRAARRRPRRRASPPGRSSTSCCPPRSSSSASRASRRAGARWRPSRRRRSPPSPAAATGTCATSSTPATRCPGSTASARSRCRPPSRRSAAAKRHSVLGYLTDGRSGRTGSCPGLHDGLGSLWPLLARALAAGRPAPALPAARRGEARRSRVAGARRPGGRRSPGSSRRPRPRAPTACRAASSPASATSRPALVLGLALLPIVLPRATPSGGHGTPPERADTQSAELD